MFDNGNLVCFHTMDCLTRFVFTIPNEACLAATIRGDKPRTTNLSLQINIREQPLRSLQTDLNTLESV